MPEQTPPSPPSEEKDDNSISEKDREKIYEQASEICEKYDISHACFLALDPKSREPIIFFRGNKITVARLTALFTRLIKEEINQQLAT